MKIMLTNVRLAFPKIFNPEAFSADQKATYGALLLMDPKTQAKLIEKVQGAIIAAAKDEWAGKAKDILKKLTAADKTCLRDGDGKADYDGFEGMQYVSAGSATRPLVLGVDKAPLTEDDGKPYAGCYVNASVEIWAQDNKFGKRVNASLKGVQFVKDGDAFGGGAPADPDEFDEIEATDESVEGMFD
jgi:hypothetical protein